MSFIHKQSSRFKSGVAVAEQEPAAMPGAAIAATVTEDAIGIPEEVSRESVRALTQLLADQHVLYHKLRNYHWNVRGMHFSELHDLFENHYGRIEKGIDETAERIRQLGYPAPGTMTEYLQLTNLSEYPGDYPNASVMLGNILEDHEGLVRTMRREIAPGNGRELDAGTVDFLTGLIREHEKMAWMLRATLSVVGEQSNAESKWSGNYHADYFQYHAGGG